VSATSWDSVLGTEFAGYRITELLGRGGMSVVYAANHLTLDRTVALKVLAPELAADDGFRERFLRESRLAAALDHPNVIPIYDAGEDRGFLYIAMRYVDGGDLRSLIERDGSLGLGESLFVLEQVASALDAAHAKGLVHRDVKPANILVVKPSDHVYLCDFGIAKMEASTGLTRHGDFVGTFEYAAPEQLEGGTVDARTDVYALGCVTFECLTGEAPYERDTQSALVSAHLTELPPRITAKRPELPAALNAVIATAMAKKKEDRYSSAGAFSDAARAAALGKAAAPEPEAPRRAPETVLGAAAASAPPAPPPPEEEKPASRPSRRLPLVLVALLVLAAAAAAGLGVYFGTRSSSHEAVEPPARPDQPVALAQPPPPVEQPPAQPAQAAGLVSLIPTPIFKNSCSIQAAPLVHGAVQSAVCSPPASPGSTFYPDRWEVSIFASAAALRSAYEELRQQQGVRQDFGRCDATSWGGEGAWVHGPGKPGGRRFCYFDGNASVIVWTHEKLGQPTHIDMLGIARLDSTDHPSLFNWWRFWHHRIGKCSEQDCVARLP
jgi:serine/threonine-protein kinase